MKRRDKIDIWINIIKWVINEWNGMLCYPLVINQGATILIMSVWCQFQVGIFHILWVVVTGSNPLYFSIHITYIYIASKTFFPIKYKKEQNWGVKRLTQTTICSSQFPISHLQKMIILTSLIILSDLPFFNY